MVTIPENLSLFQTYWWYYMQIIGRMAETMLDWIGDIDDDDKNNDTNSTSKNKDT
jgi:hypothetical protein